MSVQVIPRDAVHVVFSLLHVRPHNLHSHPDDQGICLWLTYQGGNKHLGAFAIYIEP
jgi:hypothetical protein